MNKNKKIATWISVAVAVIAFAAIFMGFLNSLTRYHDGQFIDKFTLFELMFKGGAGTGKGGPLIIGLVTLILSVISAGTFAVLNFLDKSDKKINIALLVTTLVLLVATLVIAFCQNPILGLADEYVHAGTTETCKVGAGAICWMAFSGVGIVGMIVALVQNKKAFAEA